MWIMYKNLTGLFVVQSWFSCSCLVSSVRHSYTNINAIKKEAGAYICCIALPMLHMKIPTTYLQCLNLLNAPSAQ